jgi:molecular chaperone GrpE
MSDDKNVNNTQTDDAKDPKDDLIKSLEEKYLRSAADYQNLLRRTSDERANFMAFSNENLIKKFIEVLDDLENCLKHLEDDGLKSIVEKLKKLLKAEGVEEILTDNSDFEAELHEAIEITDGKKDKVIRTYRKGYKLNDKLIRPAMVAVGNGKVSAKK